MARPRTNQVNGRLIATSIVRTTQLLSINRNYLTLRDFNGTTNPVNETFLEFDSV